MSFIHALRHQLRVFLRQSQYERELDDEMRFHLSLEQMQAAREGRSATEARYVARQRFGNVTFLKEETRRMAGLSVLDTVRQDLRYAARAFLRAPGFTVAATLTLALGIGATTAVFSVVDGVLLRGLVYRDAEQLAMVLERRDDGGQRLPSYPTFRDWRAGRAAWSHAIDDMAFIRGTDLLLAGERGPERLTVAAVTPGFFQLMGTPALLGRTFLPDEEEVGANAVVVLTYDLWQHRFGGDRSVVGKIVPFKGAPSLVIGVMPRGFAYPDWASLYMPIARIERTDSALARRGVHTDSRTVLRLRAGIDVSRAVSAMGTLQLRLARAYPDESEQWKSVDLVSIRDAVLGDIKPTLITLAGAVALVLLLACANVANLSLSRGLARHREIAVRTALGADRVRIVRQLLTESVLLAAVGGLIGAGVAAGLVGLVRQSAARLPRAEEIVVDGRVLVASAALAVLAGLLAGVVPAFRASGGAPIDRLRAGALGAVGGAGESRLRGLLVSTQFALALVLLIGAGLLMQSFRRVQAVPLGFEPSDRLISALYPPAGKYTQPAQALALYRRILDRIRAVPGVEDAAVINHLPLTGAAALSSLQIEGRPSDTSRAQAVFYRTASEDYLRTMGMRLVRGRWFTDADMRAPNAFVINETLAKRDWPGQDPVGSKIVLRRSSQARADFGKPVSGVVVGVVRDVPQSARDRDRDAEVYVPFTLEVWPWISLVVKARGGERAIPALRRAVLDVEPDLPIAGDRWYLGGLMPYESLLSSAVAQRRFTVSLIGAFALASLLLAAVGMYGVIAFGVAQRTREVGIRIALGATERRVLRLILAEGLKLALIGAVVGVAAAFAATRLIRALLFETTPTDPLTFVLTPILLGAVALLATYVPARRATRLDPTLAIRGE